MREKDLINMVMGEYDDLIEATKMRFPTINRINLSYIHFLKNNQSKKFVFLREELNKKYCMKTYISQISNPSYRSTLTKLRTHSHCLLEESHTYLNTNATCKNCASGEVETPFHFFIRVQ